MKSFLREFTVVGLVFLGLVALGAHAQSGLAKPTSSMETFRRSFEDNIRVQLSNQLETDISMVRVRVDNIQVRPNLPIQDEYQLQVLGLGSLGAKRFEGMFQLGVLIETFDSSRQTEIEVSGTLTVTAPVVVAKKIISRGQIVTAEFIETKLMPWRILPNGVAGRNSQSFLGLVSKNIIAPGEPLHDGLFETPHMVKSGERVELTLFSGPGVIIRSHGVARQSGRLGDVIRIEQPETKKAVAGSITGPRTVEVRL